MIEQRREGPVAILQLAHGKVSALDVEFTTALAEAVEAAGRAPETEAVVLTGTGGAFSAGVDLKRLVGEGPEYADRMLAAFDRALEAIWTCPRPTVAALNGHAIAGGLIVAFACDLRVMAAGKGRVGVPEIAVGAPFPWLALELVRVSVSPEHLPELVALGSTFDAEAARRRGIVQELVAPEALLERATALAQKLGENAGPAFDLQRRQLRGPSLEDPRRASHDVEVRRVWRDAATRARVQRYLDRLAGGR